MLANQIDDAPPDIALLEAGERQRGHLGSPEPAPQQHGQDGADGKPFELLRIYDRQ